MSTENTADLADRVHLPARVAGLAFSIRTPANFRLMELPNEQVNFDKPDNFMPLAVWMAPYGAVLLTVAARPAFDDGSVGAWAQYLCAAQGIARDSLTATRVGPHPAVVGVGTQPSEMGTMRLHAAFLEDGGRLVSLLAMAPQDLWPSVGATLDAALRSFAIDAPKGTAIDLGLEMPTAVVASEAVTTVVASQKEEAPVAQEPPSPAVEPSDASTVAPTADEDDAVPPSTDHAMATVDDARPAWSVQAEAHAAAGRMKQAEETVLNAVQHLGAYASVAELWGDAIQCRNSEQAPQWSFATSHCPRADQRAKTKSSTRASPGADSAR